MFLRKSIFIFIIAFFGLFTLLHAEDTIALKTLRKRWGASEIVRDLNHIKEDIAKLVDLQDTGEITANEALFYFLRMHDFDDNRKLDGQELIAAMKHSFEHNSQDDLIVSFSEIEKVVDNFFEYDDNNDGFISYPELRKHLSPQEDELKDVNSDSFEIYN